MILFLLILFVYLFNTLALNFVTYGRNGLFLQTNKSIIQLATTTEHPSDKLTDYNVLSNSTDTDHLL